MTRIDIAAIGVMAATTVLITLDMAPAVAQTDATRCSVVSSETGLEISLDAPVDLVGGGPGGGPHVLARVDITPSSDSTARHHFTVKLTNANAGSLSSRQTGQGSGCPVLAGSATGGPAMCRISGDAPNQTVSARLLLPAVQKREASAPALSERQATAPSSSSYDVTIVPRSSRMVADQRVPCDSPASRRGGPSRAGWDLATNKKV